MTQRELGQLKFLKREIAQDRQRLRHLKSLSETPTLRWSVRTQGGRRSDTVCSRAVEIAQLEGQIEQNMSRCVGQLLALQRYINAIDDSELRMVFYRRYVCGESWCCVAQKLGYADEQLPRKKHDRWLKNGGRVK